MHVHVISAAVNRAAALSNSTYSTADDVNSRGKE